MAAGINNTFRQLGAAFGVAGLGAVLQGSQAHASAAGATLAAAFVVGFNEVLLLAAAIAFVGALLAVVLVRPRDFAASSQNSEREEA
jgi:small basic protein